MDLFGIKAAVKAGIADASNTLATAGLYNEKLFAWVGNNQPVFWADNPENYVINGYGGNGDVYACIDLILTKLSYCPLLLYSVQSDKIQQAKRYKSLASTDFSKAELYRIQSKAMTEIDIPNITKLINQPNAYQTTSEWLKQLAGFYLLNGNSYNYYNGLPGSKKWTEMYVLPAPLINVISGGPLQPVKGYNVFNSRNFNNEVPDFPAENVSHFKTFNPHFSTYGSQLYGQAPLKAFIMSMVLDKDARIEQNKQVKSGGMMGMLSPEANAPSISDPKVKADLKQQIAQAKTSNDLVSRLFVAGAPAKWTQFGLSSVELQLIQLLGFTSVDIAKCFHIHPALLGDTTAATDNNMQWASLQFIYNCIMTLGNTLTDKLTRDICTPYETPGTKLLLMFDYSVLPELADDMAKISTALNTMWWVTPNEKREFQGWGKSTSENADSIIVSKTLGRLEDIALLDDAFQNIGSEK